MRIRPTTPSSSIGSSAECRTTDGKKRILSMDHHTCNFGGHMQTLRSGTFCLALLLLVCASPLGWAQIFTVPNTFVPATPASAASVNQHFSATATAINGKQNLVTGTCPAGSSIRAVNADGSVVCQQLSFFGGDGSAGNLTISASTDWSVTPPVNLNFASVTINSGQTLTVPAGTTIRCSGTFTNNGILLVAPGARLGGFDNFAFGATVDIYSIGHPGDSFRPASGGSYDINAVAATKFIQGGRGGDGIPRTTAMTSFNSFRIGGWIGCDSGYHRGSLWWWRRRCFGRQWRHWQQYQFRRNGYGQYAYQWFGGVCVKRNRKPRVFAALGMPSLAG